MGFGARTATALALVAALALPAQAAQAQPAPTQPAPTQTADAAAPSVAHLLTNSLQDPLGIGGDAPRLSWQLQADRRGVTQSAYEVHVATSEAGLASPDVWDSGKVQSDRSVDVSYGGPALTSHSRYVWSVRVWDDAGVASAWSGPGSFETGLLSAQAGFTAAQGGQVLARAELDPSTITSLQLDQPELEFKPEVRWWLSEGAHTEQTIKESVKEIADSGFGGIEFAMLNESRVDASKFAYGSQEWVNDVKLIISEATKYGLGISFTSGTNWATANIPGLDPNSEGANHDVGAARALVTSGSTLTTVPVPTIAAGRTQTFVGAVAYRLLSPYTNSPSLNSPLQLDYTSAVDLTDDAADGTLNFTASGGDYVVFSFWYRGTGQSSSPATQPAYAINYFDTPGVDALKAYWESYLFADPELVEDIRENGRVQMFMDSLEISNSQSGAYSNNSLFWTKDMRETFLSMKGYDITPYLPVFLGSPSSFGIGQPTHGTVDFAGADGLALREKVVADLRDVQTQLYMNKLMVPLRKWLNEQYGIQLRAQISYGKNLEISQPITVVDYPETETRNQRDQTDIYRVWAGGTHLQNKVLSSETGADDKMNYGYSLQEWLQKAYTEYAGGVSRVIWHGYASIWGPQGSIRWPGYEAGLGAIANRWGVRNPSSKDYAELNDHLGRIQTVLRAGVPQVDLAILYSDYAYQLPKRSFTPGEIIDDLKQQQHEGWQWKDLTLQDAGYTYDYFAPQYLDGGYAKYEKTTGLLAADGPAYQALLVYQESIPLESAKTLLGMARNGLKVILVDGAMTKTSWNDGKEAEIAQIRQNLLALPNVRLVADQAAAHGALQAMKVTPRVAYSSPDKELLSVTRKDDDATYLFLYNFYNVLKGWDAGFTSFNKAASWDQTDAVNSVVVAGQVKPYILDTWTGEITEVSRFTYEKGKTIVPVDIPDGDVRVLILKPTGNAGLHVAATNADKVMLDDGAVTLRSTKSGDYFVTLSNGKSYASSTAVPDSRSLTGWDVNVESWTQGALSQPRSETTSLGNYTEEYSYLTNKTDIPLTLDSLTTWNNLPSVGRNVSGIGTYKTTFNWDKSDTSGAYLDLGPVVESATVFVNGTKAADVNLIDAVVDIPNAVLVDGENTLEIIVTTPLANTVLSIGYNGGNLTEGPYRDGSSGKYLYDHVYTYFDNGLPQAVLTPYLDVSIGAKVSFDGSANTDQGVVSFGGNAQPGFGTNGQTPNGADKGNLTVQTPAGMFKATSVQDLLVSGTSARWHGTGWFGNKSNSGYTYEVVVTDDSPDTFSISIRDPGMSLVFNGSGPVVSGDIHIEY